MWLPLTHPLLGTWPATQACALTGNRTNDPLVLRLALNPLNHTSQGCLLYFFFKSLPRTLFFSLILETEEGKENHRCERKTSMREKHQSPPMHLDLGSGIEA